MSGLHHPQSAVVAGRRCLPPTPARCCLPVLLAQLVPAVTELVISELLWLNYSAPDKPVYVYINSTGAGSRAGVAGCCAAAGFCMMTCPLLLAEAAVDPAAGSVAYARALRRSALVSDGDRHGCCPHGPRPRPLPLPQARRRSGVRLWALRRRPPPSWTPWPTSAPTSTHWCAGALQRRLEQAVCGWWLLGSSARRHLCQCWQAHTFEVLLACTAASLPPPSPPLACCR